MLRVYSVFDDKAELFRTPFFEVNDGVAMRDFGSLCNDSRSVVGMHPEDFHLYCLGTFDDDKGLFELEPQPRFVTHAVNMLNVTPDCQ